MQSLVMLWANGTFCCVAHSRWHFKVLWYWARKHLGGTFCAALKNLVDNSGARQSFCKKISCRQDTASASSHFFACALQLVFDFCFLATLIIAKQNGKQDMLCDHAEMQTNKTTSLVCVLRHKLSAHASTNKCVKNQKSPSTVPWHNKKHRSFLNKTLLAETSMEIITDLRNQELFHEVEQKKPSNFKIEMLKQRRKNCFCLENRFLSAWKFLQERLVSLKFGMAFALLEIHCGSIGASERASFHLGCLPLLWTCRNVAHFLQLWSQGHEPQYSAASCWAHAREMCCIGRAISAVVKRIEKNGCIFGLDWKIFGKLKWHVWGNTFQYRVVFWSTATLRMCRTK